MLRLGPAHVHEADHGGEYQRDDDESREKRSHDESCERPWAPMSEDDKKSGSRGAIDRRRARGEYILQMTDRHGRTPALPRTRLGRISGRLLWVLAALLGSATVVTAAAIIHDTGRRRVAAQLIARATAEQVVTLASERLTVTALSHFGVAAHLPRALLERAGGRRGRAGRGAAAARPNGPDAISSTRRRSFGWTRGRSGWTSRTSKATPSAAPPAAVLEELAIAAANGTQAPRRFTIHVATDPRLGDRAVLTAVDFDPTGAPIAVNGLVTRARSIAQLLFARIGVRSAGRRYDDGLRCELDTLSLEVRTAEGRAIFGRSVNPERLALIARRCVRSVRSKG